MQMSLGSYLRSIRAEHKYSLNDVYAATGITTSRLSKLERDLMPDPPITILCPLANFYNVDLIDILYSTGYIKNGPVNFHGVSLLHEDELAVLQDLINMLTKGRI